MTTCHTYDSSYGTSFEFHAPVVVESPLQTASMQGILARLPQPNMSRLILTVLFGVAGFVSLRVT